MAKFTIDHKTSHAATDAYNKLKEAMAKEIGKFDSKAQCDFNDSKMTCDVKSSKFKAEVHIKSEGPGAQVSITVDLPFLLTPFKGQVQEGLAKMLKRHLS